MSKFHVSFLAASMVGIVGAILLMFYFFFSILYPFKVIDVVEPYNIKLTKTKVVSGEDVGLIFNYCKYMDIKSKTIKNLINNDIVITLAPMKTPILLTTGCSRIVLPHTIPKGLEGDAYIKIQASYRVNIFRTINYEWRTQGFEILATSSAKVR